LEGNSPQAATNFVTNKFPSQYSSGSLMVGSTIAELELLTITALLRKKAA
jgi:hypothetical protein